MTTTNGCRYPASRTVVFQSIHTVETSIFFRIFAWMSYTSHVRIQFLQEMHVRSDWNHREIVPLHLAICQSGLVLHFNSKTAVLF